MNTLETIKQHLLGKLSIGDYIAALVFCTIGILIITWFKFSNRDKDSSKTPVNFHLGFFVLDNGLRWLISLLVMFVLFRLCDSLLASGKLSMELAFGLGIILGGSLELVIQGLIDKSEWVCKVLGINRDKFMSKMIHKAATELKNQQPDNPLLKEPAQ